MLRVASTSGLFLELIFEKVTPVYEKYSASIGEEFVNELLEAIEALK